MEIIFTGGAAKAVTGTAKFAHIADKLADFARYSDKFGDATTFTLGTSRPRLSL